MKILNLYAGIGGNRKLWPDEITINGKVYKLEITAIEINPKIAKVYQDFFPNDKVIVTDAHQYLLEHFKEYDFIWSSPPCQTHSRLTLVHVHMGRKKLKYPDMSLYQEIIILQNHYKGRYVVENVQGYYKPLIYPQVSGRHYFWSNFQIPNIERKNTSIKRAKTKELMKLHNIFIKNWHGYKSSHKEQLLKNCVHPEIGLSILQKALNVQVEENIPQGKLF